MMKKSSNNWETQRQKGKTHYIIKNGVLLWGIPMAVFWSIFEFLTNSESNIILVVTVAILVFAVAGYFLGLWTWHDKEKKFLKEESYPN